MSTLVLCSGGLDSVTLAYKVHAESHLSYLLSFDYGQRHKKELNFAEKASSALGVAHAPGQNLKVLGPFARGQPVDHGA